MKSLKRRIGLHFSMQFLLIFVFVFVLLLVLLFILVGYIVKSELKTNYPVALLDGIVTDTLIEDGKVDVQEQWKKEVTSNNMWLQVINKDGSQIYEVNTPKDVQERYTASELLEMHETEKLEVYSVHIQMDGYNKSYLYILGYENKILKQLTSWAATYRENNQMDMQALEKEISNKGYLHIVDQEGKVIHSLGKESLEEKYATLEIIERKLYPGNYETDATVYNDTDTGFTWIFYSYNQSERASGSSFLHAVTLSVSLFAIVLLAISIGVTAWHANRYGQPLLLFISWFERLGQGDYKTLTEKEKKKIFTRKGKIRSKYKLYQEVIQSFSKMAANLDKARKDRERLEKTKEEWMTGISHDLRTPLATIQGYGHMLESGQYEWSQQELTDMGKTIREKGTYMLSLVEDFSLVFQLKNNKIPLSIEKIDLVKLSHHKVLDFVNDVTCQHVSFAFETGNNEALFINGDRNMLNRVLDNLLYNAVKHNPNGTQVKVSTFKAGANAVIKVEDNGVGMDEETKNNLFDRYYRGTNTEEKTEGAGLGLSITKAIIESHEGKIEVVSEVGKGTTFVLTFPLVGDDGVVK
ncbi:sensor histidine kinase [Fredinandcohnia humi]